MMDVKEALLTIKIDEGGDLVREADRERAQVAAVATAAELGITTKSEAVEAYDAFADTIERGEDPYGFAWDKISSAANEALTQGWSDPDQAYCIVTVA